MSPTLECHAFTFLSFDSQTFHSFFDIILLFTMEYSEIIHSFFHPFQTQRKCIKFLNIVFRYIFVARSQLNERPTSTFCISTKLQLQCKNVSLSICSPAQSHTTEIGCQSCFAYRFKGKRKVFTFFCDCGGGHKISKKFNDVKILIWIIVFFFNLMVFSH